jgi:hypothetical protein
MIYQSFSLIIAAPAAANVSLARHKEGARPCDLNKLDGFGVWTENPRVGGSILVTSQIKVLLKNDTDENRPIKL